MTDLSNISQMNKDPLIDAIVERTDDYSREELEDGGEYPNDKRREILRGLLDENDTEEENDTDSDDSTDESEDTHNPTAQEKAEKHGYPEVDGRYVIKILDDKETPDTYHCRLEDGGTMHVAKSKFNLE